MENNTVADRIRARLEQLGKNPSAVALEAGLNRSAVQDILRGKAANPRLDTLQKLSGALECSLDYLTGVRDDPGASPEVESIYALLDTQVTSPAISLETGVFRESLATPAQREDTVLYRDPRRPGWSADLYVIGDDTLAHLGIRKGDIATVINPDIDEEIVLRNGMLVAVKRTLSDPDLSEHSARVVEIHGADVHLVTIGKAGNTTALVISLEDEHPGDIMPIMKNHFFLKEGGSIAIEGVIARITRSLPI